MVPAGQITEQAVGALGERMESGDVIIDGGNSYYRDDVTRAAALSEQGIHHVDVGTSGGVWGLERGYCLMIGGEQAVIERLEPLFAAVAPGIDAATRTPGRTGQPDSAELGYLHCGPNGAGHFVKMVHNGIEYGLMAAYAEGLNVLRNADTGSVKREGDAETAPLDHPEYYRHRRRDRGVAARERDRVLAARLHRGGAGGVPRAAGLLGTGVGLRRGAMDRDRGGRPDPGALHSPVLALRLARPRPLRQPGPFSHAQAVRRPRREAGGMTMAAERIAILFDIDGTLIITGGAGAASWRLAFDELYGIPADIGEFTDTGMTDPDVGRRTFEAVLHRKPDRREFTRLLERRLLHLRQTVEASSGYRVLPGVVALLATLIDDGYLLGLVTGNVEAAAHIKLHRGKLNRFFSFGGYGSDSTDRGELTRIALKRATLVYGEPVAPEQAIVVGDTPHDVDGAHAAGIACVGVGSHHFDVDQLRQAGADYAIASLAEGLPL